MSELDKYTDVLIKSAFLAGIVFILITLVPRADVSMGNKIIISVLAAVLYFMIDVFSNAFSLLKAYLCSALCGSAPVTDFAGKFESDIVADI